MVSRDILGGWPEIFRKNVLPAIPVDLIAEFYCPNNGRPTHDLLTMSGLAILQEMHGMTDEKALWSLRQNRSFQVALDLLNITNPDIELYISDRTYHSFRSRMHLHQIGDSFFTEITKNLIEKFKVELGFQRLDSVHLESNMKKAGRLAIMTATVKKFLIALRREEPEAFKLLSKSLVDPYKIDERSGYDCFSRCQPSDRAALLGTVAKDLHWLVEKFKSHPRIPEMPEFKLVARVFNDQCVVAEGNYYSVRNEEDLGPYSTPEYDEVLFDDDDCDDEPQPGGEAKPKDPRDVSSESLQYPTDPDASYDAHKGKGFQAQIVETYTPSHDPEVKRSSLNLITYVEAEGAAKSDSAALRPALDKLEKEGLKPEELMADTLYGGHENYAYAAEKGVLLVAPVPGKEGAPKLGKGSRGRDEAAEAAQADSFARELEASPENAEDELEPREAFRAEPFRLSDFESGEDGVIARCPMGHEPAEAKRDGGSVRAYFDHAACSTCPRRGDCPVTITKNMAWLAYKPDDVISSKRRAWERTDEFNVKYRWRSGIEATNSLLARLGLKRLRVRRLVKVNLKVKLKALGLNIWRVVSFVRRNQEANAMI
jgi:hypothetical protein